MTPRLYLPNDEVTGRKIDFDLAADFLELSAFFSAGAVPTSHLCPDSCSPPRRSPPAATGGRSL